MQGDGEDPESPGRALRERGRSEKKSNFPGNSFSQYLLFTDFHDMYLFNMEPKVKQFIISIIDSNLQANLEEFVANEKVDDESDSDDTDSGALHLVNKSSASDVIYRPRSGVVLARADSWTLENVQERLQKMEEAMMI